MYSDTSKTTIKENELIFYQFHFTVLYLAEQCKRKKIVLANTVLTNLPTAYSVPDQSKVLNQINKFLSSPGY